VPATHVLAMPLSEASPDEGITGPPNDRLTQLLARIADEGLPIVLGAGLGGYPSYADQHDAGALLIVHSSGVLPTDLPDPARSFANGGLAAVASLVELGIPYAGPDELAFFDLHDWPESGAASYASLVEHLRALLRSGLRFESEHQIDDTQIKSARAAVRELQDLTAEIRDLAEVLSDDEPASKAVRETLAEISGTYRVVIAAIESFMRAGREIEEEGASAYNQLARGLLAKRIRSGRGHCTRIGVRYRRVGGLRDGIKDRLEPERLAVLDGRFEELASADGDLFSEMDRLGRALQEESRIVERLLLTGRIEQARQHVAIAAGRLAPLEEALESALGKFEDIEVDLGWAEPVPEEKEPVNVTYKTVNIAGTFVNSPVVVAESIEQSSIMVAQSAVPEELKSVLQELHKATAEMTSHLPEDEAALAGRDLEDLAKEATSDKPRPAFWRRAADGLLAAAKGVAEYGTPVVELVTKVAALLA